MSNMANTTNNGSYYEEYMRNHALQKHGKHDKNTRQLLTDRNAYISFLEAQLERVSAACLTSQSFEKRLAEVENSQITNDQKINSLSKVFRLNQEYMEQTTNQTNTELASFSTKMDTWMEKYAVEVQAHETRLTQVEEQFRQCDDFIHQWSDVSHRALDDVKGTMEREVEDLKTLVFATETRIEQLQTSQSDSETSISTLRELVSERLDQDLDRIRHSLSEKSIALDRKHTQLRDNVKTLASELESNWKADLVQWKEQQHHTSKDTQDLVDRLHQESLTQLNELKGLIRKCVDAQHLLSTTVVGLQHEIDGTPHRTRMSEKNWREEKRTARETFEALEDMRENQQRLQQALRTMQDCVHDLEENQSKDRMRLIHRLDAAERQFASWTHESLEKTDELRTNVLTALEHVEKTLREDTVTHQEINAVHEETKQQLTHVTAATTLMNERLQQLEALEKLRNMRNETACDKSTRPQELQDKDSYVPLSDHISATPECDEMGHLTSVVPTKPEEPMRSMINHVQQETIKQTAREEALQMYIKQLEERLHHQSLRDEELDVLQVREVVERNVELPVQEKRLSQVPPQPTLPVRPSSSSSSSSLSRSHVNTKPRRSTTSFPERRPSTTIASTTGYTKRRTSTKVVQSVAEARPHRDDPLSQGRPSKQRRPSVAVAPVANVKSKRLKELCLELMALEGSMKKKGGAKGIVTKA